MTSKCHQQRFAAVVGCRSGRSIRRRPIALACLLASSMLLIACSATAPKSPEGAPREVPDGIEMADTAYYFDDSRNLVAVESLSGPARTIEKSIAFANQDGANLIFKSTCQGSLPVFSGETDMIGKATIAVYAISVPESLTVLGVEDLNNVPSRKIVPLKKHPDGGACSCALKRCGPVSCCPLACQ